ncbi:Protein of unknown function [Rhizobium sp. RU20A]|uniref:DUF2934 domain-containing protein n=1 Tax=Rhizobium sp. RU20A TaxID=1907412 RepID=UPI000954B6CC|nr:DUF2934 domain-containing protein [Rhizobium sp. RU20A]SIR40031.1 Protein of unknown function [Rhizobium sp. RU20A]
MDVTLESRIRNRAYAIWEAEGHPHGEEQRHWEMARLEVLSAEAAAKTPRAPRKTPAAPKVVVNAEPAAEPAVRRKAKPATSDKTTSAAKPASRRAKTPKSTETLDA